MRTLIFDTETNGLPKSKDLRDQPYMIQLAALLLDGSRPVGHLSCFCVPELNGTRMASIPKERFFINAGLTDEIIDRVGMPYKVALAMFNNLVKRSDRIIAHNIAFDDKVIRAAYMRLKAPVEEYMKRPKYCSMKTMTPVMRLAPSQRAMKYGHKHKAPKLEEAYCFLVNEKGFEGAHDAMVDCIALSEVVHEIDKRNIKLWEYRS